MAMRKQADKSSALRVIEGGAVDIDTRIVRMEERCLTAAQSAAPYKQQLELAQELVKLRVQRLVGAGAVIETAELTKHVIDEMAATGIYAQPVIDGLRDYVSDAVIEKMQELQLAGLEAMSLVHNVTAGAMIKHVQEFEIDMPDIRCRDVAGAFLLGKLPGKHF